ncbi:MAG: MmcQ/YjbR family DNA-binding protein [Proteobacteria bacterium]|nr:MmcQ/YjbR family DNA-binding protein [Pseudomonadota bacterium]
MANADDMRRIARTLSGTTEAPHFDRTAFKVAKIYATLASDGQTANLKLAPEEQEFKCLLAPDVFAPLPNAWGKQGWTTTRLAALDVAELSNAIEMAWRHALPKKRPRRGG